MDKCLTLQITSTASSTSGPNNESSHGGRHQQEDPDLLKDIKEENRVLKAALKGMTRITRKLDQTMKIIRDVLGPDEWIKIKAKWAAKNQELAELKAEGEQLERAEEDLKGSICKVGRELREKEKTVWRLSGMVAKLENRVRQSSNSKNGLPLLVEPLGAVGLLPEEIWTVIFGKLHDPKDLWSCYNTCLLFERMLHPWKTSWTMEHLSQHQRRHSWNLLEKPPVCERWDTVLDHILENHPSLQPHQEGSDPRRLDFIFPVKEAGINWNRYHFSDDPRDDHPELEAPDFPKMKGYGRVSFLGRCLSLLRDSLTYRFRSRADTTDIDFPGNAETSPVGTTISRIPFLGRYMNLVLGKPKVHDNEGQEDATENTNPKKYWRQLYSLFDQFGKEIWYLTLVIMLDSKRDPWVKRKLKHFLTAKLFQSAPNIRKLEISFMSIGCDLRIKPRSFGSAPKLETLELHHLLSGSRLPDALVKRFYGQIRKLNMVAHDLRDLKDLNWPNLVELHLVDLGLEPVKVIWGFRWLIGVKMPQLRKLGLAFSLVKEVSVENLMELINGLSSSLTTLRLVGPLHGLCFQDLGRVQCAPGTLTTLEIANPWNGGSSSHFSFDILLRCFPSLENLNVFFLSSRGCFYRMELNLMAQADLNKKASEMEHVEELFVEMNKFMYDGRMYESNIWEFLPLLKVFTFQRDIYTREGYDLTMLF